MTASTLTRETAAPTLFDDVNADFAAIAAEEARIADRELCRRYLGKWVDTYGSGEQAEPVTFAEFQAAAERLSAAAA